MKIRWLPILALPATLTGCPPAEDPGEPPPIPKGGDTGDTALECMGTPPVLTGLTATPDGLHEYEQGQVFPTLRFDLEATDEDGDLNFLSWELWWDDLVDGTVDTSGAARLSGQTTLTSTRCQSAAIDTGLLIGSQGDPAWNAWYDFAFIIGDEAGLRSEPLVTAGAMPKEDGSDPDPME